MRASRRSAVFRRVVLLEQAQRERVSEQARQQSGKFAPNGRVRCRSNGRWLGRQGAEQARGFVSDHVFLVPLGRNKTGDTRAARTVP